MANYGETIRHLRKIRPKVEALQRQAEFVRRMGEGWSFRHHEGKIVELLFYDMLILEGFNIDFSGDGIDVDHAGDGAIASYSYLMIGRRDLDPPFRRRKRWF